MNPGMLLGSLLTGYLGGSSVLSAAVLSLLTPPQMVFPVTNLEECPEEYSRHETCPKPNLFVASKLLLYVSITAVFWLYKHRPWVFPDLSLLIFHSPYEASD